MRKLFSILIAMMACSFGLMAQQTDVYHGVVLEAGTNEPLVGATVVPVGGQGTAADIDGKFTLTVPHSVHTAKVSYVGFREKTITLADNMTVYLQSSETNLDDLVVVAYGSGTKESLTGSVAVVGTKEIEDRPVTAVTTALEGNAPGVMVNNSTTQPGEAPTIRIRGFSSVKGNNSPLYVVDGAVYNGSIADLNPADIESMSVLKDAASCALYGNRGANGVILITTKKAKNVGKVDLTLQVRQGFYNRALPFYKRLGVGHWMETALKAYTNGLDASKIPGDVNDYARSTFVSDFCQNLNIFDKPADQIFNSQGRLQAAMLPGYTDLDWWDAISRNGYRQEYSVNTSAAGEKYNLFASGSYLKENGYILATDYERFNGRVTVNVNPVKFLKFGLNLYAAQSESERSPVDKNELGYTNNPFSVINKAPIVPYYAHNAKGQIIRDEHGNPVWNMAKYNETTNVAWQLRLDQNHYTSTVIDGSAYGTAVIPYGFELTFRGSMYRNKTNFKGYNNNLVGSQKDVGGLDATFEDYRNHTFMQQLNWEHDYGDHHVDVLLDHENYEYSYGYIFNRKSGQQLEDMIVMDNFADVESLSEYKVKLTSESYLGRVRYNYDQRYFAEASIRRDGTSRFAKDDRWGTFWSVGASWIISKEKFMQNLSWVNNLKLRAAYGSVGNDVVLSATGTNLYYPSYGLYDFGWPLGSNVILQPAQLAPDHLRWEATKTLDVALEGSLFNDRFNFSIGYYNKRNSDLLFEVSAPMSAGTMNNMGSQPSVWQNIGVMQNIGWELAFGVDILRTKDLLWSFNLDASFLKNKIVKLPKGQDIPAESLFEGKSLYEQYTYEWAGVDKLTGQSLYSMEPNSPDYYSYDDNGQRVYNQALYESNVQAAKDAGCYVEIDGKPYTNRVAYAGRKIMGTSLPTVYGSFGTNFSWKGINLGLLFTYSLGGKSYDSNYGSLMSMSTSMNALHADVLKSWTQPTSDHHEIDPNGVPQLNTANSTYNNAGSSRWLITNNYLTLKNINISYDFPQKWVSAMKMQNLNLGFSVDNVFIATKRKGFNPQYSFAGGQGNYFVPARVFSFQLTAKF